jgi:hypothetical protein
MNTTFILKGFISGLEKMGAKYIKNDGKHLFFEIPKNSPIDDESKLKNAKKIITEMLGLGLKIKRI